MNILNYIKALFILSLITTSLFCYGQNNSKRLENIELPVPKSFIDTIEFQKKYFYANKVDTFLILYWFTDNYTGLIYSSYARIYSIKNGEYKCRILKKHYKDKNIIDSLKSKCNFAEIINYAISNSVDTIKTLPKTSYYDDKSQIVLDFKLNNMYFKKTIEEVNYQTTKDTLHPIYKLFKLILEEKTSRQQ